MSKALTHEVREVLGSRPPENRSLFLDKYIDHKNWGNEECDDKAFFRSLSVGADVQNQDLMKLRQKHVTQFYALAAKSYPHHSVLKAKLEGRLAINLSDGLIENGGIALDRTFGVPYIPGSAVKGVTRHAALEQLAQESENHALFENFLQIFGVVEADYSGDLKPYAKWKTKNTENLKGKVSFLPAYLADKEVEMTVDIVNVHTPDYYTGRGTAQELRNERPIPNYFPVVERGASFQFVLVANKAADRALLEQAEVWLKTALTERGIGAKTAAGYGWFSIDEQAAKKLEEDRKKEQQLGSLTLKEELFEAWNKMDEGRLRGMVNPFNTEEPHWPRTGELADVHGRYSLFHYLTQVNTALYEKEKNNSKSKVSKALKNLSDYLKQPLP